MLHFDTKERVSASEALTSQYLLPYHDSTDEPSSTELFKWSFSEVDLSIEDWKLILFVLINPSKRNINHRLVTLKSWVFTSRRRLHPTHDPSRIRYVSLVYVLCGSIPDSLPSLTLYTAP
jgi:hypothetical protein